MIITKEKQIDRIKEIINSCENESQLESCRNFINPKYFEYKNNLDEINIINLIIRKEIFFFIQFDWKKTLNLL